MTVRASRAWWFCTLHTQLHDFDVTECMSWMCQRSLLHCLVLHCMASSALQHAGVPHSHRHPGQMSHYIVSCGVSCVAQCNTACDTDKEQATPEARLTAKATILGVQLALMSGGDQQTGVQMDDVILIAHKALAREGQRLGPEGLVVTTIDLTLAAVHLTAFGPGRMSAAAALQISTNVAVVQ